MKHSVEIIIATTIITMLYGVIHNQITIRISPEFFTIALGRHSWANGDNLTTLAIAWGVTSTWWVGLIGGFVLAFFARVEDEPRIRLSDLKYPALVAIIVTIVLEIILGNIWSGFHEAYNFRSLEYSEVAKDGLYLVAGLHDMSYLSAAIAFIGLSIWVIVTRFRMRQQEKKKNV